MSGYARHDPKCQFVILIIQDGAICYTQDIFLLEEGI